MDSCVLESFGLLEYDPSMDSSDFEDILNTSSRSSRGEEENGYASYYLDGSTCSSPCTDDTSVFDGERFKLDSVLDDVSDWLMQNTSIALATADHFRPESLAQPLISEGDPYLTRSEVDYGNVESLRILLSEQQELPSQKRQINFVKRQNSAFQDQQTDIFNWYKATNDSDNNNIFFVNMEASHQQQLKEQELLQFREKLQQQQQGIIESEIKREEKESLPSHESKKFEAEVSPMHQKVKRKKRKYERRASARKSIQLYQFMLKLLDNRDECVTWVSREDGIFKLLKSKNVAQMWGKYKKNENMTYESLSRALRHYYAQEILIPVPKKLHYKFCKKTLDDWYSAKDSC